MAVKRLLLDVSKSGMAGVTEMYSDTETYEVQGSCIRCGACCRQGTGPTYWRDGAGVCEMLSEETVDGKKLAVCDVVWEKPYGCRVWPSEHDTDLPETCGYVIVKKG